MTTQMSSKLAALSVALLMNATMLGTVAYLFNGRAQPASLSTVAHTAVTALAKATV